jgi:hypothetical protein
MEGTWSIEDLKKIFLIVPEWMLPMPFLFSVKE